MTGGRPSRRKLLEYCLAKPGAWRDEPWEGDVVVKVADKIFAFLGSMDGHTIGLKCGRDQDEAGEWRERFPDDVSVMAYIGRYGWNTFTVGGAVDAEEILDAVDASYADVAARLPKAKRP
ncbi:MAG: MmcQ/YjbR family DNA-binding protein [Actinomycetota bacterium]|nr:MmcQ/YjbR family DNA-binding protein [Actinomycetota bacterium]